MKNQLPPPRARGFSLVEVVISLGIVSFALLAVIGAYGSILNKNADNAQQRSLLECVDALRAQLNEIETFNDVYGWARQTTPKELAYVTFKADEVTGDPDINGRVIRSTWLDTDDGAVLARLDDYTEAAEGRWLKARLTLARTNNPAGIDDKSKLDADPDKYFHPLIVLQADITEVESPLQPAPDKSTLITHIGVLR